MTVLNTLSFAKYSVPTNADPATKRRNKVLAKIDEQILLATDDTYAPTKRVTVTDADGNTKTIDRPKRVKRWWSVQTGQCNCGTSTDSHRWATASNCPQGGHCRSASGRKAVSEKAHCNLF